MVGAKHLSAKNQVCRDLRGQMLRPYSNGSHKVTDTYQWPCEP